MTKMTMPLRMNKQLIIDMKRETASPAKIEPLPWRDRILKRLKFN